MIDYQLGVIGAGTMAEAILRGVLREDCLKPHEIVAYDPLDKRQQILAMDLSIMCSMDNTVPGSCPHVLLAVKPHIVPKALKQIAEVVTNETTVISIAAGVTTELMDKVLGGRGRLVRVMPNTPMSVGWGVSALAAGPRATSDDIQWTQQILAASGKTVVVEEKMLDAVTAVSGSGPAYFFYLIEAMTAAGVAEGLNKQAVIKIKITVLPDGSVSPAEMVTVRKENTVLEELSKNKLKTWRFRPLPEGQTQKQNGTVTLVYQVE